MAVPFCRTHPDLGTPVSVTEGCGGGTGGGGSTQVVEALTPSSPIESTAHTPMLCDKPSAATPNWKLVPGDACAGPPSTLTRYPVTLRAPTGSTASQVTV